VWVGNDDFTPMKKVTGGALPAQIWSGFMQAALKGTRPTKLPRAEPIYDGPLIAEVERGTFFDRLGNFFERLLGGSAQARTRIEPPSRALQRPQPRADVEPDNRDRYAYQPRNDYVEPRQEPPARSQREYAGDRYAYPPEYAYRTPRRGYGYREDPRYDPRYAYPPRYGYRDPRRTRDPREFNRWYPYR
jgi:penicillin-binding protein 1A